MPTSGSWSVYRIFGQLSEYDTDTKRDAFRWLRHRFPGAVLRATRLRPGLYEYRFPLNSEQTATYYIGTRAELSREGFGARKARRHELTEDEIAQIDVMHANGWGIDEAREEVLARREDAEWEAE